jgi:hypothetical protein
MIEILHIMAEDVITARRRLFHGELSYFHCFDS